jgi:hypothetical protein
MEERHVGVVETPAFNSEGLEFKSWYGHQLCCLMLSRYPSSSSKNPRLVSNYFLTDSFHLCPNSCINPYHANVENMVSS